MRLVRNVSFATVLIFMIGLVSSSALAAEFTAADFTGDAYCRGCHSALHEQWQTSMHAKAYSDEVYRKTVEIAISDLGGIENPDAVAIQAFCLSCHTPIGTLIGDIPPKSQIAASGINCDFCHTIEEMKGIGNAAYVNSPGNVKRGPFVDAISPSHDTTLSTLHTQSEFCGGCHDVYHPTNGLPLEQTYTEWKNGPYPAENVQCQHCMMGQIKNAQDAVNGPKRPLIFGHVFAGGNFTLGNRDEALKRLRSAATITIKTDKQDAKPGDKIKIDATLTNSGAGHKLPTGLTEARDMRLVISAVDEAGKSTEIFEEKFGTILEDATGKHDGTVQVWRAVKIFSDNRLAPRESKTYTNTFAIPSKAAGRYTFTATLKYRSASQEMTALLNMKNMSFAVMTKKSATVTLPGGEKKTVTKTTGGVSWIIWAGIAVFLILVGTVFFMLRRKTAK